MTTPEGGTNGNGVSAHVLPLSNLQEALARLESYSLIHTLRPVIIILGTHHIHSKYFHNSLI